MNSNKGYISLPYGQASPPTYVNGVSNVFLSVSCVSLSLSLAYGQASPPTYTWWWGTCRGQDPLRPRWCQPSTNGALRMLPMLPSCGNGDDYSYYSY